MNEKLQQRLVFIGIVLIMGMDLIDTTLMNNILPKMAESFHVTPVHMKLGISIYMITIGMFLPASSWLAEKIGYKTTLIIAAIGFAIFSVLSGLSQTDNQLFVFRAFQGIFAAFSAPVASLAYLKFSENMVEGTASLSNYTLVLAILGQIIGGLFASISPESWRLAFFINGPLALIAIIFLFYFYPGETLHNKDKSFDISGFLLLGSAIALIFGFGEIVSLADIPLVLKIGIPVLALTALLFYKLIYKKIKDHIIDFAIYKNKAFLVIFLTSFVSRFTTYWVFFAWPIELYILSHLNTIYISIMSVCLMLGTIVSKHITKKLIYKFHFRKIMILGLILMAIMLVVTCSVNYYYNYYLFCFMVSCYGFALGVFQTSSNAALYASDSEEKLDSINTLKQSSNMIAGAFSISFFTIAYGAYKALAYHKHWEDVFFDAFYFVCFTTAGIQLLLCALIFFFMKDNDCLENCTHKH